MPGRVGASHRGAVLAQRNLARCRGPGADSLAAVRIAGHERGAGVRSVGQDDFARRFSVRGANLMWLLGAGASNAAGLPTAHDLVIEFKRMLYVSQSGRTVRPGDLAEPAIRNRIEAHVESLELPESGAADEYAAFFEAAFPHEADRARFIEGQLGGAKPSYGHMALASLMSAGLCRLVWTTNFDTLVADACADVFGTTGSLTTATLDAPDLARHAIAADRWPLEVKLHGDFRSHRLKNTRDELRRQDRELRHMLVECSARFGLVVVGCRHVRLRLASRDRREARRPSGPGAVGLLRRPDRGSPGRAEQHRPCRHRGPHPGGPSRGACPCSPAIAGRLNNTSPAVAAVMVRIRKPDQIRRSSVEGTLKRVRKLRSTAYREQPNGRMKPRCRS